MFRRIKRLHSVVGSAVLPCSCILVSLSRHILRIIIDLCYAVQDGSPQGFCTAGDRGFLMFRLCTVSDDPGLRISAWSGCSRNSHLHLGGFRLFEFLDDPLLLMLEEQIVEES